MRKKVKLTPLQRQILRVLAPSGQRSLPALLDDLQAAFPVGSRRLEIKRLERSLGILGRMGCLYLSRLMPSEEKPFTVDEFTRLSLEELVRWDDTGGGWGLPSSVSVVTDIVVRLTSGGLDILELHSRQNPQTK